MRLISLNLWGGRAFEGLKNFVEEEKGRTDVFCFQETLEYSMGDPDKKSLEAKIAHYLKGVAERRNLYSDLVAILDGHKGFLTEPYSSGMERLSMFVRKGTDANVEAFTVQKQIPIVVHGRPYTVGCIMQHASVKFGSDYYEIFNLHGLWQHSSKEDTPERLHQSEEVLRLMSAFGPRKILAGDFNLLPNTKSTRILEEGGLRNLVKEHGITNTRSRLYKKELRYADYVFVSRDVHVDGFRTVPVEASDHIPLVLDFE